MRSNPLLDLTARPVIAHRGASGWAPENTMAAFDLAVRQGADAFELDVRLTGDGVPVVLHDPTLDRTTDAAGPLAALSLAELRRVDAGARFSPDRGRSFPYKSSGVGVPPLVEVLRAFPEMPVLIEIKEVAAQEAVRQVLIEERAAERCVLASEQEPALALFCEAPFVRGASGQEISALYWATLLRRVAPPCAYRLLSVPQRYRGLPVPTRRFVAAARRMQCPVHVWTVNHPRAAQRLWTLGVAGIVTNVPDRIRAARG
ncbi:MAG TPA: glycerophosphodiester phosphodiesterase [Gemmatimonadales bacterium]